MLHYDFWLGQYGAHSYLGVRLCSSAGINGDFDRLDLETGYTLEAGESWCSNYAAASEQSLRWAGDSDVANRANGQTDVT